MSATAVNVEIPSKMRPFATQAKRHKIARGGRGSGKSWSIARLLVVRGVTQRTRWLCCREVQKSIRESSHRLLSDQIEALGLSQFYETQRDRIIGPFGTEFVFTGLREHTADSIKSYENFDGAWVEEAHSVSARSAEVLVPTIRTPGSEIWWSYNPDQAEDYIHQRAEKPDDRTLVVDINWSDNPWFPQELDDERLALRQINEDLYQHIWEGKCRSVGGLIFKRDWFQWYDQAPSHMNHYLSSDYAVTAEQDAEGREPDWTEHGIFGIDSIGNVYIRDWWSGQVDADAGLDAWINLIRRWRPLAAFDEKGVIRNALSPARNRLMRERNTYVSEVPIANAGNKAARALGFAARAAKRTIWLPKGQPWAERLVNQLCAFNGQEGRTDDMVDVCSLFARGLDFVADALPAEPQMVHQDIAVL